MKRPYLIGAAILGAAVAVMAPDGTAVAEEPRDGQWYLEPLQVEAAHQIATGAGVRIGIIDSGVDVTHPDLEGAVVDGKEFLNSTDYREDPDGHGTAVASVLAGRGVSGGVLGIAPDAELVVAATGDNPSGSGEIIPEAIDFLVDADVDVISVSLGSDKADGGAEAVERAVEAGIPVVAGAGNSVDVGSTEPDPAIPVLYPAAYPHALAVTGSDQDGGFSEWSVYGKDGVRYADDLTVAAPANDIPEAVPGGGYRVGDGTSLAAPIVAGTLALIKERWPDLGPGDWADFVNQVLLNGTTDVDNEDGFDRELGYGIVQPLKALEAAPPGEGEPDPDLEPTDGPELRGPTVAEDSTDTATEVAAQPEDDSGDPRRALGFSLLGLAAASAVVLALIVRASRRRSAGGHSEPVPWIRWP